MQNVGRISISLVIFLMTALLNFTCFAETGAPNILNYQGTLADDAGTPVNGLKTMVFRIYDSISATPENALWQSGDVEVPVQDGLFSVNLGESPQLAFPEDLFIDDTRFLGITVDGIELIERKRLVSVPYALNAGSGIPAGGIIMWSGSVTGIPEGWALCDGSNGTPDLRDRFLIGAGNSYQIGERGGHSTINLNHSHTMNHTHSHTHTHTYSGTTSFGSGDTDKCEGGDPKRPAGLPHTHTYSGTTSDASISDTSGPSVSNTGSAGSDAQSIMPPYYALCFIMKL